MKKLKGVAFHQLLSFSKLIMGNKESDKNVIFFPGCSLSNLGKSEVELVWKRVLKESKLDVGIFFGCCGRPGEINSIKSREKYKSKLEESLKKAEIREIITACPNCHDYFERYFSHLKIRPVWEVINFENIKFEDIDTIQMPCPYRKNQNEVKLIELSENLNLNFKKINYSCCLVDKDKLFGKVMTFCISCREQINKKGYETVHYLEEGEFGISKGKSKNAICKMMNRISLNLFWKGK